MTLVCEALPRVLNITRDGFPEGAVLIDRTTRLGNPFRIGRDGSRAQCIAKHRVWIRNQPHLLAYLRTLRGRDMVCHCTPLPCHGDDMLGDRQRLTFWALLLRVLFLRPRPPDQLCPYLSGFICSSHGLRIIRRPIRHRAAYNNRHVNSGLRGALPAVALGLCRIDDLSCHGVGI